MFPGLYVYVPAIVRVISHTARKKSPPPGAKRNAEAHSGNRIVPPRGGKSRATCGRSCPFVSKRRHCMLPAGFRPAMRRCWRYSNRRLAQSKPTAPGGALGTIISTISTPSNDHALLRLISCRCLPTGTYAERTMFDPDRVPDRSPPRNSAGGLRPLSSSKYYEVRHGVSKSSSRRLWLQTAKAPGMPPATTALGESRHFR